MKVKKNEFKLTSDALPEVLLLNNDELEETYMSEILRKADYEVTIVGSAAEAIRALQSKTYKVLVLDMILSSREMNLIRDACNSLGINKPYLVLFISPSTMTRAQAYDWGAQLVMSKPIQESLFIDRLKGGCPANSSKQQSHRQYTVKLQVDDLDLGKGGFSIPTVVPGVLEGDYIKFQVSLKNKNKQLKGIGIVRYLYEDVLHAEQKSMGIEAVELDSDSDITLSQIQNTDTHKYIPKPTKVLQ